MTAGDERYFKLAEEHLYGELAIALGIEKDKVSSYIEKKNRVKCTKNISVKKLQKNVKKKYQRIKRFYDIMRYMVK